VQLDLICYAVPQTSCGSFSREVKLIQKNLKQLQAESNKRDSKIYINMFARMTRDTPVATKVSGVSIILVAFSDPEVGNYCAMFGLHLGCTKRGKKVKKEVKDVFADLYLECFSQLLNCYA
jgi:hypothetical protein